MNRGSGLAPTLDRTSEPWVGTFPGLGRVHVDADGSTRIELDPAANVDADARAALEYAWAEPLGWARRGLRLAAATTLVAPGDDAAALLLGGPATDVAALAVALVEKGWFLLADTMTPLCLDSEVRAHPRRAPWLVPAAVRVSSLATRPWRDGPARLVDAPRWDAEVLVAAHLTAVPAHDRVEPALQRVRGRGAFRREHRILAAPLDGWGAGPDARVREDLLVARLPTATWSTGPGHDGAAAVAAWWAEVAP